MVVLTLIVRLLVADPSLGPDRNPATWTALSFAIAALYAFGALTLARYFRTTVMRERLKLVSCVQRAEASLFADIEAEMDRVLEPQSRHEPVRE